jgi:hypothetical protein
MGSTLGLLLSVLTLATPPNPALVRKLFVEFSGVCAFVPNPNDPQKWIVVFPNVSSTKQVNKKPKDGDPQLVEHAPYVKVWNSDHFRSSTNITCTPSPTMKAKLCDLKAPPSSITVDAAKGAVAREETFDKNVVLITTVAGEDTIDGKLDTANTRISNLVFVNQGKLIDIVNPLTRWDFGDGNGPRPIARAVLWEIDTDSADPNVPVYIRGEKADGTKWHIALAYDKSTVISIAMTDADEKAIEDYYVYQPPKSDHDHDFLLNYALLAKWNSNGYGSGKAKVECKGSEDNCRYPILDSSAAILPRSLGGRKANCFMVRFPPQLTPTPTP